MDSTLRFPLTEVKEVGELAVKAEAPCPDAFADGALTEGALTGPKSRSSASSAARRTRRSSRGT